MTAQNQPAKKSWLPWAAPPESAAWADILNGLLPLRPIAQKELQSGNVLLSRAAQRHGRSLQGVWTKIYRKKPGSAGEASLDVFNDWESLLIQRARTDQVDCLYQLATLSIEATHIRTGDTSIHHVQTSSTTVQTLDAGPSLNIWREMSPWVIGGPGGDRQLAHPFVQQYHFLKLIAAILTQLESFHKADFVHCDFHPGNITLPAAVTPFSQSTKLEERYQVALQWDKLKFIDLGYSLNRNITPLAVLPLDPWQQGRKTAPSVRMSPHLHGRLLKLLEIADQFGPTELFSRSRWKNQSEVLRELNQLDWREDLYQLGYWLKNIRDGWGSGSNKKWGNVERNGPVQAVNQFITDFPNVLMKWGTENATPDRPHLVYVDQVTRLLAQLDKPANDHFIIYRSDHDEPYKQYFAQSTQRHHAAQKIVRLGAVTTLATAVVGIAAVGGQHLWLNKVQPAYKQFEQWVIEKTDQDRKNATEEAAAASAAKSAAIDPPTKVPAVPATPPPDPPIPSAGTLTPQEIASYAQVSETMGTSQWWLHGRRLNLQPDTAQIQWVKNTMKLANLQGEKNRVPLASAQLHLGQMFCGGVMPSLLPQSVAECGKWLAAALVNIGSHSASAKVQAQIADDVEKQFDQQVYGPKGPDGKVRGAYPGHDVFSRAILLGLLIEADRYPRLAYRAAHVQACLAQPLQREQAIQTLQGVVQQNADKEAVKSAISMLAQWQSGNFSICGTTPRK